MALKHFRKKNKSGSFDIFVYGLFVWLIPFIIAFLLYTPQGAPILGEAFFNSVMSIVVAVVTCIFLLKYMKGISFNFLKEGIKAGLIWVIMSIALDMVFLLGLSNSGIGNYFTSIGIGYITIMAIAIFSGMLLEEKMEQNKILSAKIHSAKK